MCKNTEERIGKFYLDLLAEDENGRVVAIENKFNHTDHSHLGQLLTYAAGCDAKILIWVTECVEDEHRAAVEWLNHRTDTETEFYLVKVEVFKIDDSMRAYKFIPVVTANKWQKRAHESLVVKTPEDKACGQYFHRFIEELNKSEFSLNLYHNHRDSTRHRWFSAGVREWVIGHEFDGKYATVYLDFYKEKKETALMLRSELIKQKESFTSNIKDLEWDGWHYSSIGIYRKSSFSEDEESLNKIRKWAVESMLKLNKTFSKKMLKKLEKKVTEKHNEK